jgi:hypothetical protein
VGTATDSPAGFERGYRLAGRLLSDLLRVKHRHGAEEHPPFLILAVGRLARGVGVDGHQGEDPDRLLTLADLIAKLQPGTEPAHIRGIGASQSDQQLMLTEYRDSRYGL